MGDDEDEDGIGEAVEGEFDSSSDLPWVLVSEPGDLGCGLAVAEHGFDEGAVRAFEVDRAGDDLIGEEGVAAVAEVDLGGELIEPVGLVNFAGHVGSFRGSSSARILLCSQKGERWLAMIHQIENNMNGICLVS